MTIFRGGVQVIFKIVAKKGKISGGSKILIKAHHF